MDNEMGIHATDNEKISKPSLPRWATGRGTGVLEGPRRGSRRIA